MPSMDGPWPPLGLGTGAVRDRETCLDMVTAALEAGYRHIDTAAGYDNEQYVGTALDRAGVAREDVLVATKVLQHDLSPDAVHESVAASRDRLGVDTIDLLYVHWPTHEYDPEATLAAFDEVYAEGLVDGVGVSNFTYPQLIEALDLLEAPVTACQTEYHPLYRPTGLVDYCRDRGIAVVGYSPLADGRALDLPVVREVAESRDVTPGQVCLAWALAHDVTPIPKSTGAHLEENLAAARVDLPPAAVERIDAIRQTEKVYDPDWAPWR